jgi:hypothetical protein
VSAHIILRGAELALTAERAPGAAEALYVAECLLCRAESGLAAYDPKPVAVWSIEHTRHHDLNHCQFLVTTRQHWRVDPLLASAPEPARPPTPRTHARPRPRTTVLRTAADAAAFAAPLVLLALLLGAVLLGTTLTTGTG